MFKLFQRKIEDFKCKNCGVLVKGNGYTNHCPKCLYSEHVDINPGDRANSCKGLMEPIGVVTSGGAVEIVHKCKKCGAKTQTKTTPEDNKDKIIELSANPLPA